MKQLLCVLVLIFCIVNLYCQDSIKFYKSNIVKNAFNNIPSNSKNFLFVSQSDNIKLLSHYSECFSFKRGKVIDVLFNKQNATYIVIIKHNRYKVLYSGLSKVIVSRGDIVKRSQQIGEMAQVSGQLYKIVLSVFYNSNKPMSYKSSMKWFKLYELKRNKY